MTPFRKAHLIAREGLMPSDKFSPGKWNANLSSLLQLLAINSVSVGVQGLSSERNFHFITLRVCDGGWDWISATTCCFL